jgi:hypothetical protein
MNGNSDGGTNKLLGSKKNQESGVVMENYSWTIFR